MNASVSSLLIRAFGFLLSAGQTIVLARVLGAEDLGLYAGILALITILATPTSIGLSGFLTRELAHSKVANDFENARGLVRSTNALFFLYSCLSIMALIVLVKVQIFPENGIVYVALSGIMIILLGLDQLRAGAMRGMGSALLSQFPEVLIRPGVFIFGVLFFGWVIDDFNVTHALLAFIIGAIFASLFGQFFLHRQLCGYRPLKRVKMSVPFRQSRGLILLGLLGTIQTNIDIALLSFFGFHVEAGLYRVALLGIMAILFVYNAISSITVRDLAVSIATNNRIAMFAASDRLTVFGTLAALVATIVYVIVGAPAIQIIFGAEFKDANQALIVLGIGHAAAIACGPAIEIIRLLPTQKYGVIINAISIVLSVVLSVAMLGWNPLLAVAVGSAVGNAFRRLLLSFYILKYLGGDTSIVGAIRRLSKK